MVGVTPKPGVGFSATSNVRSTTSTRRVMASSTLLHELDQDEAATERFRSIVVDYPEQARAPGALAALADMGRAGVVSPYQAGTVRLLAREYAPAGALF